MKSPFRVARKQTDYDRALDLRRWQNLGLSFEERQAKTAGHTCLAGKLSGLQCRNLPRFPQHAPLYCLPHWRIFERQLEKTDG